MELSGIILCMHPATERWCYNVMPSLIGWVHAQNNTWIVLPMASDLFSIATTVKCWLLVGLLIYMLWQSTFKWQGYLLLNVFRFKFIFLLLNWSCGVAFVSLVLILIAWCFSTRALAAKVRASNSLCPLEFPVKASIGLDDGWVPNRWQAIIWTNDSLIYWCIYESLSLND